MGTNVSKQVTDQTQTVLKNTLNQQNNNTDNKINCSSSSSQKMNIGSVNASGCSIDITQNVNVKLDCTLKAAQQVKTEQGASATAKLQALATQKLQQSNAKLNLFQTNVADATQKSNQYLKDNVQNIINSTIKSTINTNAKNNQEIDLKSIQCSGGSTIKVSQDGILDSIAKSSSTQIVDGWMKATGIDMTKMDDKQDVSQKNSGISLSIIFVIIGIVVLGVLGLAVYFVTTSEKTAVKGATGLANAASNVTTLSAPNYRGAVPQPQHLGNID